ncbi:MAG: hypothetical protein PVH61_31980 [Candidatus Aminicenantes bacterium]|jgi:WD40 repeat protein
MSELKEKLTKTTFNPSGKGKNPYKALNAYEEIDQKVFGGRQEEAKELFQLVKFNSLSVVFGKSGIGKTSLINAGLSPLLREKNFRPIRIRLNFSEKAVPLKKQICSAIKAGLAPNEIDENKIELESRIEEIPPNPISVKETLWEYFHRITHFKVNEKKEKTIVTPVLVFDQFEEIFTVGKHHEEIDNIIDELYYLIEDQLPSIISDRVLDGDAAAERLSYLELRPHFKVILCLREDYLPHMNDLKTRIPSIDRALFRVIHLNGNQAREVIEVGFDEKSVPAILRCFYPEKIRDDQKETVEPEKLEVEPVFLSLLCHQLFEKQPLEFLAKQEQKKILEDFYDSEMEEFPDEVKIFIEENLLNKEGYRTPFYLRPDDPLNESIDRLVDRRIIRRFKHGNRPYVEIIHDELANIVKEQREKRLKEIREQKEKEHFKKGLRRWFVAAISVIAVMAIILAIVAFIQSKRVHKQYIKSQIDRLITQALVEFPRDNTKAIRIAEEAIKKSGDNSLAEPFKVLSEIGYSSYHRPFYIIINPLKPNDVIYSAVFSSDNQRILTAHEDGSAYILDLEGNTLLELKDHKDRIMSAVFSPDETMILTASWDKTARLCSRNGKLLKELNHDGPLTCASFSPNGKQILTASLDHTACLWDLQGKKFQEFKHEGRVISAVFSPDGRHILTASWDETAKLWNREGRLLADLNKHNNTLSSALFSPDGNYILTGSWDKTAKLWNDKGEVLTTFEHDREIVAALFSPGGKIILTASLDGTVKLWDRESRELETLIKHEGTLSIVVFSPDGEFILTTSEDGAIKLWDLQGNQELQFNKHSQKIYAAAFAPNGNYLFTSSGGELSILWDLQPNIVIDLKHNAPVSSVVFSPDGQFVLTISNDGIARLWDNKGKFLASLKHDEIIFKALFSPQMDFILTASNDGTIKRWAPKGELIDTLKGTREKLKECLLSKDGNKIFTVSGTKDVISWSLQGVILNKFEHDRIICKAAFSPNGGKLITVSCFGGFIKLWDLEGKPPIPFKQDNNASVVFSMDGNLILTASKTGEVIVRNLSGKILYRLNLAIKNRELISAAFSPNGKLVLILISDGVVKLWNLNDALVTDFTHNGHIYSAEFSPGGEQVLTASIDKKAKLWDLRRNLLATFIHEGAVFSAAFSPDGERIVTASRDGTVKVWLTPAAILQWLDNSGIPPLSENDKMEMKIPPYEE